ncbi:MAG: cystathionine beta-lyase [Alphaproteobacteria bacterium]|nr:cystathionine beta-lyase [Alphaproteobacteria bacterium]
MSDLVRKKKPATIAVHAGRAVEAHQGAVNPPVYHVSTILYPDVATMEERGTRPFEGMTYGRFGTPTTFALEEAVCALEGGYRSVAAPSGLAAITLVLESFLKHGDHVLVTDSIYHPTRRYCDGHLKANGIETTYYDPLIGAGIADLIRPNTKLVFVEAPGSLTFEIQDIPAISAAAHKRGVVVAMDNTWATPLFFKPFEKGVDLSVQAATKYIVGHADAMMGMVTCANADLWQIIKMRAAALGLGVGAEEAYLALRGLRTLPVRLERHQETAILLATWLKRRPEVLRVLHPALQDDPGHKLWRRDFSGSCGLFAFVMKTKDKKDVDAFLDALQLFGLGYSWGGFESLAIPADPGIKRTVTGWDPGGLTIRLHAGLEDADDLIADLEQAFGRI